MQSPSSVIPGLREAESPEPINTAVWESCQTPRCGGYGFRAPRCARPRNDSGTERRYPPLPGYLKIAGMSRFAFLLTHGQRLALRLRLNEAGPLMTLCAVGFFGWMFVKLAGA